MCVARVSCPNANCLVMLKGTLKTDTVCGSVRCLQVLNFFCDKYVAIVCVMGGGSLFEGVAIKWLRPPDAVRLT